MVDTRTLTVTQVAHLEERAPGPELPPVALSPDEQSFAWLREEDGGGLQLVISAWARNETYALSIDRTRMRYADRRGIGPDWVDHHFAWQRDGDGADRLVARDTYAPLPYRGALTLGAAHEHQMYLIGPGAERLRAQVVALLVESLGGKRLPDASDAYTQQVRLGEDTLGVSVVESLEGVVVSTSSGDPVRFQALGQRLDALWASRQFDDVFEARAEAPRD